MYQFILVFLSSETRCINLFWFFELGDTMHQFILVFRAGHLRVARGLVAPEGVQAGAVPAHQGAGGRVRHPRQGDSGLLSSLNLALEHVVHGEGLEQRAPQGVQDGVGLRDWVAGF